MTTLRELIKSAIPASLRSELRRLLWATPRAPHVWRRSGTRGAVAFLLSEPWLLARRGIGVSDDASYGLTLPGSGRTVQCRPRTSDLEVFWQVIARGQFSWLPQSDERLRVLDLGANVGMATLAILERWPRATVLAVEPDRGNFEQLQKNTEGLGPQVVSLQAAAWSSNEGVVFDDVTFRDGREWTVHVRTPMSGEGAAVRSAEVTNLLTLMGWDRVDLLKVDIEGAERELLKCAQRWLPMVRAIAIELHDDAAVSAFRLATEGQFELSREGELTVAWRTAP